MRSWIEFVASGFAVTALVLFTACGPKYPDCETDEHCKDHNQVCVDKLCRDCATSAQCTDRGPCAFCGPQYTCDTPAGAPGDCCASDLDCKQGKCWKMQGAQSGTCAQCASNADCSADMKCVQGSCVPKAECQNDADCGAGRQCENGVCVAACQPEPVYFDFDEYAIRSDARDILNRDYECLKSRGQSVTLEGNCDERGSDEYNLALGTRRASAAQRYLKGLGFSPSMMSTTSFGEERPVCTQSSEDCWWKNRRVDLNFR
ncbi:MAG: OmpA family protein [Deltaproteobacteria bacterium]|nr:OmpA family protein [Deltaproteobacteria bacterium]